MCFAILMLWWVWKGIKFELHFNCHKMLSIKWLQNFILFLIRMICSQHVHWVANANAMETQWINLLFAAIWTVNTNWRFVLKWTVRFLLGTSTLSYLQNVYSLRAELEMRALVYPCFRKNVIDTCKIVCLFVFSLV